MNKGTAKYIFSSENRFRFWRNEYHTENSEDYVLLLPFRHVFHFYHKRVYLCSESRVNHKDSQNLKPQNILVSLELFNCYFQISPIVFFSLVKIV